MTIEEDIETLTRRRQEIWRDGCAVEGEVDRLSRRLEDLYEIRRQERAQSDAGSRDEIARRARIEVELERMMSSP